MLEVDQRLRVERLLRGERHVTDLDRLFSDVRFANLGLESVREIGHLAAHRGDRDRGIVLGRAADIQISARHWARQLLGIRPTLEAIEEVGLANLRIMPSSRVKERFGLSPQLTSSRFKKAVQRMRAGHAPMNKDKEIVRVLGHNMMWQCAFDGDQLTDDFALHLISIGALKAEERTAFEECSSFIGVYALSLMHGARLALQDGQFAILKLAKGEASGCLRIAADIPVDATTKPISVRVPIFETALPASDFSEDAVLAADAGPIEVSGEGVLVPLGYQLRRRVAADPVRP